MHLILECGECFLDELRHVGHPLDLRYTRMLLAKSHRTGGVVDGDLVPFHPLIQFEALQVRIASRGCLSVALHGSGGVSRRLQDCLKEPQIVEFGERETHLRRVGVLYGAPAGHL